MLEIIGFVLLLNASRRPIPPHTTDIRSNIAYLESLMSTTRSWVSRVGVGSYSRGCNHAGNIFTVYELNIRDFPDNIFID